MIYQSNNEFKVFPLLAEFSGKEEYLTDKTEFEKILLEQLQMQEDMLAMEEEREPVTISLPAITYTDVVLTTEQSTRFAEVKDLGLTLDEVRDYTIDSVVPKNIIFKLRVAEEEVVSLTQADKDNKLAIIEIYETLLV